MQFIMDFISSKEFHKIFRRFRRHINLKRKFTEAQIEAAICRAIRECKKEAIQAETAGQRIRLKKAIIAYRNLLEYNFARRTIREANADPDGIVGMTLKYGAEEAERRILAQRRAHIRMALFRRRIR
jgi:hypothetical protein